MDFKDQYDLPPTLHQFSDLISYPSSSWTLFMCYMPSLLFLEHSKNARASDPFRLLFQINRLIFLLIYHLSLPLSLSSSIHLPPSRSLSLSLHLSVNHLVVFFQFCCQISHQKGLPWLSSLKQQAELLPKLYFLPSFPALFFSIATTTTCYVYF